MRPHARIRKAIRWGGAVVTVLCALVVLVLTLRPAPRSSLVGLAAGNGAFLGNLIVQQDSDGVVSVRERGRDERLPPPGPRIDVAATADLAAAPGWASRWLTDYSVEIQRHSASASDHRTVSKQPADCEIIMVYAHRLDEITLREVADHVRVHATPTWVKPVDEQGWSQAVYRGRVVEWPMIRYDAARMSSGIIAMIGGMMVIVSFFRAGRRRMRGLCEVCGYERAGLAADARCPECGSSPAEPAAHA
jgi:hypothetical protein